MKLFCLKKGKPNGLSLNKISYQMQLYVVNEEDIKRYCIDFVL